MGATQSKTTSCTLETSKGSLRGIQLSDLQGNSVYQRFTSIPYARPPVGPLRWRRPQPLPADFRFSQSGSDPGDYTEFGPTCPQPVYAHSVLLDNPEATPPIENIQNEDCLYLNVWVPSGTAPSGGWPVQFFLHGGWLQVGNPMQDHEYDPFDLLKLTKYPRIIVAPTYRLNLFGFLTGPDLVELGEEDAPGNYGFWDQRLALEWVASNIELFGGNPNNITVGGLSAGANSTFFQLYYDSHLPSDKRLIKRVFQWSNAVGLQPNPFTSPIAKQQFDGLCAALNVDSTLPAKEKLEALRSISTEDLVACIPNLKLHTFRASTDNSMIPSNFLSSIHDGTFASLLASHNVSIVMGEVAHESRLYRMVNPPSDLAGLRVQLSNYYPPKMVDALLKHYPLPSPDTAGPDVWADKYAEIVADCQVHAVVRGMTHSLLHLASFPRRNLHRYRISWRATSLDHWAMPEVGVCHAGDMPIWWISGCRAGYTERDRATALQFVEPFGRFLYSEEDIGWGTEEMDERAIRVIDESGRVSVETDDQQRWEHGLAVWRCMRDAQLGSD